MSALNMACPTFGYPDRRVVNFLGRHEQFWIWQASGNRLGALEGVAVRPLTEFDPTQVGPYRILAELGRGGMGRVLLAGAPDGRLIAIKLVREIFAEDDGFRERFRREVAASRRVSGAYTAPVIDADPNAPMPWLASAFVFGPSLQQAVEGGGVLPEEPALRLAAGLAAALAEIHRAGIVHRDLKPANVLLAEDGPRVIDFGIARATDNHNGSQLTRTGSLVGSPQYMSPEQAEGRELTPTSDVFSLGSVLVMACTGTSPFAGASPPQTLYRVVHAEPDLSSLPPMVRRIAAACLAKDPGERPDAAQLREMIGDITASARPWPAPVLKLISDQRAEIARLLDPTGGETVDLAVSTPPVAATRLQQTPPPELDNQPDIEQVPTVAATRLQQTPPSELENQLAVERTPISGAAATAPRRARLLAGIAMLASLATLVGVLVWTQWPSTRPCADRKAGHCVQASGSPLAPPSGTSDTSIATDPATSSSQPATPAIGPASWDSSGTDKTPLTEDALLPQRFTDDKNIDFARVAGGAKPCDQAGSSDVVKELTGRGCTEMMTGVYLEQPGPNATPDNPVLVSVQVFPFPDAATANDMYNYLNGPARWQLTTWCTQTGVGSKPCIAGIDHGYRQQYNHIFHRYVIAALANRTDLTHDGTIGPWLASAAGQAANSSGPQNYGAHN
jgi:serine/threonine protein kinase